MGETSKTLVLQKLSHDFREWPSNFRAWDRSTETTAIKTPDGKWVTTNPLLKIAKYLDKAPYLPAVGPDDAPQDPTKWNTELLLQLAPKLPKQFIPVLEKAFEDATFQDPRIHRLLEVQLSDAVIEAVADHPLIGPTFVQLQVAACCEFPCFSRTSAFRRFVVFFRLSESSRYCNALL